MIRNGKLQIGKLSSVKFVMNDEPARREDILQRVEQIRAAITREKLLRETFQGPPGLETMLEEEDERVRGHERSAGTPYLHRSIHVL